MKTNTHGQLMQKIAIPSYFYPGSQWERLVSAATAVGLAIINPNSGPGDSCCDDYAAQVARAKAAGVEVIGYVSTRYGERGASEVSTEARNYFGWYDLDGIFLDEASSDVAKIPYYSHLFSQIKQWKKQSLVVLNPGTNTDERYLAVADILVNFEGSYRAYVDSYEAPALTKSYDPSRFWHLVHGVPSRRAMRRAVVLSKERGAGWIYVTPRKMPNPWDILPDDLYWREEIAAVATLPQGLRR